MLYRTSSILVSKGGIWVTGTASLLAEYVDELEGKTCLVPASTAIMFCYFNNLDYFHKYLQEYKGEAAVVIL